MITQSRAYLGDVFFVQMVADWVSRYGTLSGTLPALVKLGRKVMTLLISLLSPIPIKKQLFLRDADGNTWLRRSAVGCFGILPQSLCILHSRSWLAINQGDPCCISILLCFALSEKCVPSAEQVMSGSSEMFSPFGCGWACRGAQLLLGQQKSCFLKDVHTNDIGIFPQEAWQQGWLPGVLQKVHLLFCWSALFKNLSKSPLANLALMLPCMRCSQDPLSHSKTWQSSLPVPASHHRARKNAGIRD